MVPGVTASPLRVLVMSDWGQYRDGKSWLLGTELQLGGMSSGVHSVILVTPSIECVQ